jgi:AsmA protein
MKRVLLIVGIIFVLLAGSVAALTFLIDPNRFRPLLESELSSALAREVHLGDLKLSLWKGSVTANDLAIADDPAYSKASFVKAKSLGIEVEVWPLISSRKLHVTGLTIDQPVIALIEAPSGEWNFSSLGGKAKAAPAKTGDPAAKKADLDLSVKLVRITDGEFSLGSTARHSRPLALRNVVIEVKDFSAASEFPFTLRAKVVGGGSIALDGKAGPLNANDTAASPLSAALKIDALDLAASGATQNAPSLAGVISIDGSTQSDGQVAHVKGKIKAERLKLAREGTPAKKAVQFDFAVDHNLKRRSGHLQRGDLHIGAAPASLTGTYAEEGEITTLHMNLDAPKMAVSELSELLPAMAVVLPRGSSLQGGTASAKISVAGPADRLVTAGTVSLDNTKLANFDLGKKLAFVEALAGIRASNETEIQTLGASVHYGPEGGQVQDLKFVVPSIGNLDGAGTISPSNDLLFQMRATVRAMSVPFTVQGPASDPSFRPDVKGIAKEELKKAVGSESVKGLLKGILGGK